MIAFLCGCCALKILPDPIVSGLCCKLENRKYWLPQNLRYKTHFSRQWNCWSVRCSWSCSNYIFIIDLTPDFNRLARTTARRDKENLNFGFSASCIRDLRHPYCRWVDLGIQSERGGRLLCYIPDAWSHSWNCPQLATFWTIVSRILLMTQGERNGYYKRISLRTFKEKDIQEIIPFIFHIMLPNFENISWIFPAIPPISNMFSPCDWTYWY